MIQKEKEQSGKKGEWKEWAIRERRIFTKEGRERSVIWSGVMMVVLIVCTIGRENGHLKPFRELQLRRGE